MLEFVNVLERSYADYDFYNDVDSNKTMIGYSMEIELLDVNYNDNNPMYKSENLKKLILL